MSDRGVIKYRAVLLFGAPGSGKGTHGRAVGSLPGFFYFSSGDTFRNLRPDDPTARVFLDYSSRGLLVPDEITLELWAGTMRAAIAAGRFDPERDTLVLDGIPRNVSQAKILDDHLRVKALLHLTCRDPEVLVQRLQKRATKENRHDDARLEVIRKRLETYENETRPVLEYYSPGLTQDVDCGQTPIRVLRDVAEALVRLEEL